MNTLELKAVVDAELRQAVNYRNDESSQDRTNAYKYYMGEPFGDEVEGRSQIVSTDVADTIEWIMPELMKIFTPKDYVEYKAQQPGDIDKARQASDYANFIMETDNQGFLVIHNWFKDALMYKMGIVKIFWEERDRVEHEEYEGLTQNQLVVFTDDKSIEILGQEAMQGEGDVVLFDIQIKRTVKSGTLRVENVPPEEFIYSRRSRSLEDCRMTGHCTYETVSDLVERGYKRDIVEANAGIESEYDAEQTQRFQSTESGENDTPGDPNQRMVLTRELYMRVDFNGDGVSEMRRVVALGTGNEIVENEEWDEHPFAVLSPILMPHALVGRSVADLVMDIQRIKSSVVRQLLDNMYFINNQRTEAVVGKVNLDDLLTSRPGGVVRVKERGSITPLVTPQIGQSGLQMLEYVDQIRDSRTGFNKFSAGIDPDSMQDVKVGTVDRSMMQMMAKVQLIARVMAETGMRRLFVLMAKYLKKYQDHDRMIRLRDKFIDVDPRTWLNEFDLEVNVGLGSGQPEQRFSALMQIAGKQEQILDMLGMQNPVVKPSQYVNTLNKMIELVGFKDPTQFFASGEDVDKALEGAEQPEDPAAAEAAAKQQQAQAEFQMKQHMAEAEMQLKQKKMEADIALDNAKMEKEFQLREKELGMEYQLKQAAQALELSNQATNVPRTQ